MAVADILYMPALHRGYVNYLDERDGAVGLLNEDLVRELPRLDRDIRAIGSVMMQGVLEGLYPGRSIVLLNPDIVDAFVGSLDKVVMPDEDVSHVFADNHLSDVEVEFRQTFLRWDRQISTAENIVVPDRRISTSKINRTLMDAARTEGDKSPDWWRQVGALIVIDSDHIILSHNHPYPVEHGTLETFGDPRSNFDAGDRIELQKNIHAEADAIANAARFGTSLEGADIYVTTFPCPPCARLIATAGIKRLYYRDGYSLLDAEDILKSQGIEIILVQD